MTKVNIKLFSEPYINLLLSELRSGKIIDLYRGDNFEHNNIYAPGDSIIYIDSELKLNIPDNPRIDTKDLENAKIIYESFRDLNEIQASDPRLWTYLTHITFWEYMKKRWPIDNFSDLLTDEISSSEKNTLSDNDKTKRFIEAHWFLKSNNDRWLRRNGISRLWWYAHLTYDSSNIRDPYELTSILLSKQDVAQQLLERSLGRDKNIVYALLSFMRDSAISKREDIRRIMKELNLEGGIRLLSALNKNEIYSLIEKINIEA